MKRPWWWCLECGGAQYTFEEPCIICGGDYADSWKCVKCSAINVKYTCECGGNRHHTIHSGKLGRHLSAITESGQTVYERLVRYTKYTAFRRSIPAEVAEEAVGIGMERLLKGIDGFAAEKGQFLHWAMRVMKNALLNAAREDVIRNDGTLSLDGMVVDYGEDLEFPYASNHKYQELLRFLADEGHMLDMATYAEKEEEEEQVKAMLVIARKEFGLYTGINKKKRRREERYVFDACLQAFEENERGWLALASRRTGVPKYTLSRRKTRAKRIWDRWREGRTK
jgi:RNA polymerase sigma factor (sigma-70 family)